MRSRTERRFARAGIAGMLAALLACSLVALSAMAQTEGDAPTETQVLDAMQKLRADPNLSKERTTRTLSWSRNEAKPQRPGDFARWIREFFSWLGQLSRALVWVVGGMLALVLVRLLVRLFGSLGRTHTPHRTQAPTHVRDLDIRPESLPDDIGAAALALWQQGAHRAALALLYRGLLSRLAHVHRLPIRDSTTEGDCLALASKHLSAERRGYVARLIDVWQHATYGGHEPDANDVQSLCAGFDAALSPAAHTTADTAP